MPSSTTSIAQDKSAKRLYIPSIEDHPESGIYKDLIDAARVRGAEYSKIWDLFAFQESFTIHLGEVHRRCAPNAGIDHSGDAGADRRLDF